MVKSSLGNSGAAMLGNEKIDMEINEILQIKPVIALARLMDGYRLSSLSEGKSPATIAIVESSVHYLAEFLVSNELSTDVTNIGTNELRHFIVYLKEQPRFAHHRITRPQDGHLPGQRCDGKFLWIA